MRQIVLAVERVGKFRFVVVVLAFPAVGVVAVEKQVGMQMCGGLSSYACAQSVYELARPFMEMTDAVLRTGPMSSLLCSFRLSVSI